MGKIAFVFPGQGAQYTGMGKQIAENFPASMKVFEQASDVLAYDVAKMVFDGDEEILKITENTQPAILTVSVACLTALYENTGVRPDVVAGLSLGEYSAHVAAGTFTFADAVGLVRKRGRYMQEAVPADKGTMAAVIGLEAKDVVESCKAASSEGIVEPANLNCPGQVVIAGEVKAVEKAVEICRQKGARRAVVLPVSAPFHCSMLTPAGEKLKAELEKIDINDVKIPVIANVSAEYITDKKHVKDTLIRQVSSPVLWEDSVRLMIRDEVGTFVEIGPGKVLSGFIKRINPDVRVLNVEDMDSLNAALEMLK